MEQQPSNEPPPFDPSLPSLPISYPLKTLGQLASREYLRSFHFPFNQASERLPAGGDLPPRRRIMVCHDMRGGYTADDRLVQGGANAEAYAMWHWHMIDVFVYFSHNLVTLPPPCWVNAAHRHGVKVLGTFIMEDDMGAKRLNKMLSTTTSAHMYAERLAELAVALGFDGWLINLEVSADKKQVPILEEFVSHLTKTMHSSAPGSLVIWYDSITMDGYLIWQNQLNAANKPFFDRCDGIFVNYFWEENLVKLSGDVAGDRKFDVYMGIDVFGRGTYGGGEWKTNVALDVIKKYDVSAAIFAPGWVYETKQKPDFQTAQNRWWGLVEKSWGTVQRYPKQLPFYSNFDQGHGYHISIDGQQVWSTPWNNISSQSFQPFIEYPGDKTTQPIQVSIGFKEASYSGGGNVTFRGSLGNKPEFTARLFQGELLMGNYPVYFTYSVKSSGTSRLGLALVSSNATNDERSIFLAASETTSLTMNKFSTQFTEVIMPDRVTKLEADPGWVMQESSIHMKGHVLKEIRAVCYTSKLLRADDNNNCHGPSDYFAVLGDIKIAQSRESTKFPPATSWLVDGQFVKWTPGRNGDKFLSVKISWKLKDGNADIFTKHNMYVSKIKVKSSGDYDVERAWDYLGTAAVKSFYVSSLEVAFGISSLKFVIQASGLDGACQKLEDCPFFLLQVPGTKIMKEERLECKCGRKITILVPEKCDNSGKLIDCRSIHGFSNCCDHNDDNGREVQKDETQRELSIACVLLVLNFTVLVVCVYWISCLLTN